MSLVGQTRTSSLGVARPLPPSADIGPGGQSVGQAAQFCLVEFLALTRAIGFDPGALLSTRSVRCRRTDPISLRAADKRGPLPDHDLGFLASRTDTGLAPEPIIF